MKISAGIACISLLAQMIWAHHCSAEPALSGHIEVGLGATFVRPLVEQSASGATVSAGVMRSMRPGLRTALEMNATLGGEVLQGAYFEPPAKPGSRTLSSLLLGIDASSRRSAYGAFGFVGAGVGRMGLKNAAGRFSFTDPTANDDPNRNLTALAAGLGVGYRFRGGPGMMGFQIALHSHALIDHGQMPTSAYALTLGLATTDEPRRPRPKGPKHEGHAITAWPR